MGRKGTQCCGYGCNKRNKKKGDNTRSDSDGSEDEETQLKRRFPRTFHAFPSDPLRRQKWVVAMRRHMWIPSRYSRLCSDHFRESDINRTGQVVQLREDAVPSRFKQFPKHLWKVTKTQLPPAQRCSAFTRTTPASCPTSSTPAAPATSASQASQATPSTSASQAPQATPSTSASQAPPSTSALPIKREFSPQAIDEPSPQKVAVIANDHIYQLTESREVSAIANDHLYQITQSPKKLREKLERSSKQIIKLRKELKIAQQKSRRLKVKVTSMKTVVKDLKNQVSKQAEAPAKVRKKKKAKGPRAVSAKMELQLPPHEGDELSVVDMHTGGEPLRIVLGGYPRVPGDTVLAKRRYVQKHLDHLRGVLMLEPRGHYDMYGALIVDSELPEADLAVLFMHNDGYSTMCGHAVIALGRFAVDYKLVKEPQSPETQVNIHCPCGLVRAYVEYAEGKTGGVRFHSVPAFAFATDVTVAVEGYGEVKVDISYGGAFYAFVDAQRFGLDVTESKIGQLVDAATAVTKAVRSQVKLRHPTSDDLAFLYGTILTDGKDDYSSEPTANVCVFAKAQVDRSPTGSGVTARVALQHHKGLIRLKQTRTFVSGVTGSQFTGKAVEETKCGDFKAVVVEVAGRAFYTGASRFVQEPEDQLTHGFLIK